MEEAEDKDFYCSLKKKKLQVLCKRYGLSPCMTKSNLANSLCSFFNKKKILSSVSPIESSTVGSVAGVPMGMIHALKDRHVKIKCAIKKDDKINDYQAVECDEELSLIGTENCGKAPNLKNIQGSPCPDNDKKYSTLTCPDKELLGSLSAPGCRVNCFHRGVGSTSVYFVKNNIPFEIEAVESLATQIPTRNLFDDLALAEKETTSSEKPSNPFSSLEFHVSSGKGINIIVDLDASSSGIRKRLENEVCNCHCIHSSKFQSLREELELLMNSSSQHRFSVWRTDTEKPMDHDNTLTHSIPRNSCNNMHFSDIACLQNKASCSLSRGSILSDVVVPVVKFEKGHDDSAVSGAGVFAEEREHVNLAGDSETSVDFHPNMPLKEKPVVKVGVKRRRPTSEFNQRLRTRSSRLTKRVLPRKSMRLVQSQGF